MTSSSFRFGKLELMLHKVHCLAYSTSELLQDAGVVAAFVEEAFSNELVFKIEDAIVNGDGAGKPLGILNSEALVSVTGGSSAGTIVSTDVIQMWSRLWAGSQDRAEFVANQDTLNQLLRMHTGTLGGDGSPLYLPMNAISGRPYATLFAKPILFLEQCATVGTAGDSILIDPSQYLEITKGRMQFSTSGHVQFKTDEMAFRGTYRIDGQPKWSAPLTPFKGSKTQSPCVCISTRT